MVKKRRSKAFNSPPTITNPAPDPSLQLSTSSRILSTLAGIARPLADLAQEAAKIAAIEAVNGYIADYLSVALGMPQTILTDAFDLPQTFTQHELITPGEFLAKTAEKYGAPVASRVFEAAWGFKNLLSYNHSALNTSQTSEPTNSLAPRLF